MLYQAKTDDGLTGRIEIAQSNDGFNFISHPEPILEPDEDFDRGGCEDPRVAKVGDTYFLIYVGNSRTYHRSNICLATSRYLFHWEKPYEFPVLLPRCGFFDCKGIEPVPNPVIIDEGILLIYNGWGEDNVYKTGGAVFSKENPSKVINRTDEPLLTLSRDYGDNYGTANHCVAEGLVK